MAADMLTKLEKKAFSVYYRDGLFEIFFGLLLLAGVLRDLLPYLDASVPASQMVSIGLMLAASALFTLLKKQVTAPRLGYASFSKGRKARIQRLHLILVLVVAVSFLGIYLLLQGGTGAAGADTVHPNYTASVIVTLLILAAISLVGYFLDYTRLYGVAVLFAATEPAHLYLEHHTSLRPVGVYVNTLPAVLLILLGLFALRRFLRTYPAGEKEANHE